jgi:hypothetical protein
LLRGGGGDGGGGDGDGEQDLIAPVALNLEPLPLQRGFDSIFLAMLGNCREAEMRGKSGDGCGSRVSPVGLGKKNREPNRKNREPEPKELKPKKSVHVRFLILWNRNTSSVATTF